MQDQLYRLAFEIDQAIDRSDSDQLQNSLIEIKKLTTKKVSKYYGAQLNFFATNAYSGLRHSEGRANSCTWSNSYLEKEIYHLRLSFSACQSIPFDQDRSDLRFRVGTNLGNVLNHVGRFVEAIEIWDRVIQAHPEFAMAIGNRGHALCWYARHLYDTEHQPIFLHHGFKSIKIALELGVEEHAAVGMKEWLVYLESITDWDKINFKPRKELRVRSKQERAYRTWCLAHRLFLNPLNDLGETDIAANDVLTFPSVVIPIAESSPAPPEVYGIYNQLKQEYVSARYMLFEAIEDSRKKFTSLTNESSYTTCLTIDTIDYGLRNLKWLFLRLTQFSIKSLIW